MTARQLAILESLDGIAVWARPMDVGARDGSHHAQTLMQLVTHGLVERTPRYTLRNQILGLEFFERPKKGRNRPGRARGSYRYRITAAGRAALSKENR